MIGTSAPLCLDADDRHVGAADHEVRVHDRVVVAAAPRAPRSSASRRRRGPSGSPGPRRCGRRRSRRRACRGRRRRSGGRASRRRRARPRRGSSRRRRSPSPRAPRPRPSPRAPRRPSRPAKRSSSPRTIVPPSASGNVERTVPSVTASVGRREDLLRRHVDEVRDAVDGALGGGQPAVRVDQADAEVGARAGEVDRVRSVARRAAPPAARSRSMCSRQAATGSGSSRRVAVITASQRRSTSGSPKTAVGPALVRVADDRPLDQPAVLRVEQLLGAEPRARALGAALVEVGEELGLGLAGDRDRRAARVDHVVEQRERPRRASSRASPRARAAPGRAAGACRGRCVST